MTQGMKDCIAYIRDQGIVDNTTDPRYTAKVAEMKAKGLEVYHIIEGTYNLGEPVHMVSYCYVSSDDNLLTFVDDLHYGICYANVVNDSWGIEELGSIGIGFVDLGSNKYALTRRA